MTQGDIFNRTCIGGKSLPVQIFQGVMQKGVSGFLMTSCSNWLIWIGPGEMIWVPHYELA